MQKEINKRSGLRIASKVFAIIDIVLSALFLAGAIAMIVYSTMIYNEIAGYPASQTAEWAAMAESLRWYGIILCIEAPLMMAFAIVGLKLVKDSDSFGAILTIGILNVIIGGAIILGILLIIVACIECYPNRNKK